MKEDARYRSCLGGGSLSGSHEENGFVGHDGCEDGCIHTSRAEDGYIIERHEEHR